MAWFESFRNEYGFAAYQDNRTSVSFDIPLLIVTYLCVLVSIATLIATLGIRGRERWSTTIRAMYAVGIGSVILACLVGYGWQEGRVRIKCPYIYRNNLPFEGFVGIKVGLNYVNVTLEGNYRTAAGPGYVYFAESMPYSDFGHEPEGYHYFLIKGLPEPILKVMGFLTVDEGDLRWGRSLHASGYYTMALLWTSFAFWIIANVLLCSVIVYGAYMFTLTGLTMLIGCITYHVCQCRLPMGINFGEATLTITYSWCYWLTLASGCLTLVLGLLLILADHFAHEGVAEFFHLEKLIDEDAFENDIRPERTKMNLMNGHGVCEGPRRGSIFLDPCRQPADNSTRFLPGTNHVFVTSASDMSGRFMKTNPIFCGDDEAKPSTDNDQDEETRIEMERVCEDSQVCQSTKKPSLATLKEHRDNHANERVSASTSGDKSCRYTPFGKLKGKVSYPEQSPTFSKADKEFYVPCRGLRRESCPVGIFSSRVLDRSISEASCETDRTETLQKESFGEISACVDSDEDLSHEVFQPADCAIDESQSNDNGNSLLVCEKEEEIHSKNTTQYVCDGTSSDVVVNIS
ncbi:unnamed protein product [Candidula unifasciata]|uniref:Dual oxidase maturation factor 1 n=1 Tax=Candidula unifasciata TaxID=100452 RepID=A0A8S3Z8H7_9EUPU|nr:unnamed protein product [Candidula unifasciata]